MPDERTDGGARPVRRAGCVSVELDENVALYDEIGQLLILLNPSAAAVWERCDGETTIDDMVRALSSLHPDQAGEIVGDVHLTVDKLRELGLVGDATDGADGAEAPSDR
jgi:Coenzyme PQQ synthesis protein D (PqqD)